jgi:hypothetical protein
MGGAAAVPSLTGGTTVVRQAFVDTVAEDSTSNKTLSVKMTLGTASGNLSVIISAVHLEVVR